MTGIRFTLPPTAFNLTIIEVVEWTNENFLRLLFVVLTSVKDQITSRRFPASTSTETRFDSSKIYSVRDKGLIGAPVLAMSMILASLTKASLIVTSISRYRYVPSLPRKLTFVCSPATLRYFYKTSISLTNRMG